MICDACGSSLRPPEMGRFTYPYDLVHDVTLIVLIERCSNCDNEAAHIPNVAGLHAALARTLSTLRSDAYSAALLGEIWIVTPKPASGVS